MWTVGPNINISRLHNARGYKWSKEVNDPFPRWHWWGQQIQNLFWNWKSSVFFFARIVTDWQLLVYIYPVSYLHYFMYSFKHDNRNWFITVMMNRGFKKNYFSFYIVLWFQLTDKAKPTLMRNFKNLR